MTVTGDPCPDSGPTQPVHLPGTAQHQALLRAIVDHYANDPRILAVIVFGSLGRGNWDRYSDIDLNIIVADDARVDPVHELRRLGDAFTSLGERVAVIVPDGDDAGDLVLETLMQLSARYHPLARTSPNILDGMRLLAGRLAADVITAAGEANRNLSRPPVHQMVDAYVRYAVVAHVCLQRGRCWLTLEVLHRMRGLLLEIYTRTHGGLRAHQTFEQEAGPGVQARLGATLPQYNLPSLRQALERLLAFLEQDLDYLSNGQVALTRSHQEVIRRVRQEADIGRESA